jgi:hypothetical protein
VDALQLRTLAPGKGPVVSLACAPDGFAGSRKWAVRPEDAVLPLEEIAHRLLNQKENDNAKAAEE